jgi:hypothetical protein
MKDYKKILKRLEERRFLHNLRSKYIKKLRRGGKLRVLQARKTHLNKKSTFYYKMGQAQNRNTYHIKVPKVFDLSREPDTVMNFLKHIEKDLSYEKAYNIEIDHSETIIINLDASYLFDQKIKEYRKYWSKYHINIRVSGIASESVEVNNFLLSFGLLQELNISNHNLFPDRADKDYYKKYITYKEQGSSDKKYLAGNVSTKLVQYFDSCFRENGFSIKEEPKANLIDCFGEIIKNAEEHSGEVTTRWNVLGCYNKTSHICSFSIINYGKSFFQSLSNTNSTAKDVIQEVADVVYANRGIIEKLKLFGNKNLYEEAIWTYMAIQDGISAKRSESGKASTRGQGIMDVVEFIDKIRNTNKSDTYLTVFSGTSFLKIDYTYPLTSKKMGKNNEKRRVMYLNSENSFSRPPDLDKLKIVQNAFFGVIFSGYFTIDKDYLITTIKRKE